MLRGAVWPLLVGVSALVGCNPKAVLPLKDGEYTCGATVGVDQDHAVKITDANGRSIDMFAMVDGGEIATLDLGPFAEVSGDIDSFEKFSNTSFRVRIVNDQGGNGKFFMTGDAIDDTAWGNWLRCDHDG